MVARPEFLLAMAIGAVFRVVGTNAGLKNLNRPISGVSA
jgi:hypothetical protein